MKRILPLFMMTLFMFFFFSSCTKSSDMNLPDDRDDVTVERDVTEEAVMTVNLENREGADGAEGSLKLIDKDTLTKFLVDDIGDGLIVEFTFEEAVQVASYEIASGNDFDPRDPMDWQFSGSDDGENWVLLDKQDYEMFVDRYQIKRYSFKNTQKFKHYRWYITKLYAGQMFQASEFRLLSVPSEDQEFSPFTQIDTIARDGLTLLFVNKTSGFNETVKQEMTDVFFTNYPRLLNDFNPNAQKEVAFRIEPSYDGVAYVFGGFATFGATYMSNNPNDLDVVTHEVMHLVQSYASGAPGWLTEGIADYVRFKYGLHNDRANWTLPNYESGQHYTDAYRVTARFLVWVEQHYDGNLVKTLDALLRHGQYQEAIWQERTGHSLDDLWTLYGKDPQID